MRAAYLFLVALFLSGCTTVEVAVDLAKKLNRDVATVDTPSDDSSGNASVKADPRYKVGDPYEVLGIWYYPERDLGYDETGIASWYGDEFAGRLTANGEIFDPDVISAAHKTLPMPSVVRVINLDNGRALVVRINDRGPFVAGRIIDLSREAARVLGFQKKGIARVRVQILAEESLRLERQAKDGQFPLLGQQQASDMPEVNAASVPKVTLSTSSSSKVQAKTDTESVSSLELFSSSRSTDVITLEPVSTRIYIQVGAFSELSNAESVQSKIEGLGNTLISTFDNDGQLIHRVRIGPILNVQSADETLANVFDKGFKGAKIVLE
jgi:rare lipoprotein A